MNLYKKIDMNNFDRSEYFHYFMSECTLIECTVKVDVTNAVKKCKKEGIKFQPFILFKLYTAINAIDNFKYDMLNGELIMWNDIIPTFSSFNSKKKLFSTLCINECNDFTTYHDNYIKTVDYYANSESIVPQKTLPENIFNVSGIPWLHFEHFSSNSKLHEGKIHKMITLGKYEDNDDKLLMPITIQVSHAIVDGYHVSLLFENLQKKLDNNVD